MPSITLTLSAAHLARFIDAICWIRGYQTNVPNPNVEGEFIPNPESRADFARRMIINDIRVSVRESERQQAVDTAVASVNVTAIDIT